MPASRARGRHRLLLLACLCAVPGVLAGAEDATQKAAELQALQGKIRSLQSSLQANRERKSRAEQALSDVETRISDVSRALRRLEAKLQSARAQRDKLHAERQDGEQKLAGQSERLAREVRAAYAMGRQQQVKLLLNQEQPDAVGRMQVYFSYFSRARSRHITSMRETLGRLSQLEADIEAETREIAGLKARQQAESTKLQTEKQAREQAVEALVAQLLNQGGELKRLQNDEKQLQELVYSLQELLADIPADTQNRPFKSLKGRLRWPAQGQLTRRFGTKRGDSGLTWRGVVIEAPRGGKVRAVSQGRVAFADWLRGFGLLLIIDHGDGYMSLYGQNEALYKEVGEWVDSGEVVAILGASGGRTTSGLYFELRHNGRPVNPRHWCTGRPGAGPG